MQSKKKNVFQLIFISLIILNIFVFIFLFKRPPRDENPGYDVFIEENLKLNDKQIRTYHQLIRSHKRAMFSLQQNAKNTKNELYKDLNKNTFDQNDINQKINKLNSYQKEIETLNFNHFWQIKQICTPEQLTEFKKISKEFKFFFRPN